MYQQSKIWTYEKEKILKSFNVIKDILEKELAKIGCKVQHIEPLMEKYIESKQTLFKVLGYKTKLVKDITEYPSEIEIWQVLNSFLESINPNFRSKILEFLENLPSEDIFNNSISKKTIKVLTEKDTIRQIFTHGISPGAKISKMILELVPNINYDKVKKKISENYSIALSKIKAIGKLVISLEPLDYLLMSESTSNWTNCCSLSGVYKSATLSYMCDNTTLVAYAYRDIGNYRNLSLPRKFWRQLIFLDLNNKSVIFNREYPHQITNCSTIVGNLIMSTLADFFKTDNCWETTKGQIIEEKTRLQYIDYKYMKALKLKEGFPPQININSQPPCPVCGKNTIEPLQLLCYYCRLPYICDNCGSRLNEFSIYKTENNNILCRNCFTKFKML